MKITPAMAKALRTAARRERGTICPIVGVHAAAEQTLIDAMERRGLIEYDSPVRCVPVISAAGRAAIRADLERQINELPRTPSWG